MPRSSIAMASFDGGLFFDINQYLIDNHKTMSLRERRSICLFIQQDKNVVAMIEKAIDKAVKDEHTSNGKDTSK